MKKLVLLCIPVIMVSCLRNDVYEKNVSIPGRKWSYTFRPAFRFEVKDTASAYNMYVVLRHTNTYAYNNIWLNVSYLLPGDSLQTQNLEVTLANDQQGWLGVGMDDIYEIRHLVTPRPYRFSDTGIARFTLQQIMRDDPLPAVMNAGIRVEKAVQ